MDEQFPDGFDADYLNGVSTWAQDNTELFPGSKTPGMDATLMAIEGITGLQINYWAMVNLEGFKDLVDAVGGVTLNVRSPIPVGGLGADVTGYIQPGVRKLDGHDTLWYARAREGSDDYSRMARQKCVMNAMLHQISPQSAVMNFQKIANASSAMISTNVPSGEVERFVSPGPEGPQPEDLHALAGAADDRHRAPRHRRWSQSKVRQALARSEGTAPAPAVDEEEAATAPRWSPAARWARCARGTPPTSPTTSPRPAEHLLNEREVTARGVRSRAPAPVGCGP